MKRYIGTKTIHAKPMTRADYNTFRGWDLPANENGADDGYLVEYPDGGAPNTHEYTGYISWSPKAQFEAAYRERPALEGLLPHQQRVVDEKAELDEKMDKLTAFMDTPIFATVPAAEQERLVMQLMHMGSYTAVLHERIAAF